MVDTVQAAYRKLRKGGILVFFQSYSVLCQFTQILKAKIMNVFFEQKDMQKSKAVVNQFNFTIQSEPAVFCCVFNGKFAEGIDFSDDQCRIAINVSIPYASIQSSYINEKMAFQDQHFRGQLDGQKWYEIQAYRAINQACGRGIRHANDYCQIVLLDQRLWNNRQMLSKWVQNGQKMSVEEYEEDSSIQHITEHHVSNNSSCFSQKGV